MNFGLDFIKKLKPVKWTWPAGPDSDGKEHFGFIAQDVDKIVSRENYGFVGWKRGYMTLNYEEFLGPIVKSIQQLDRRITKLEKQLKK